MNRKIVEQNQLFAGISGEEIDRMLTCSKSKFKQYNKGVTIFKQEEKPQNLFVLLKGRVAIVKHLASGRKYILYEVEENSVFGEHYFFGKNEKYFYDAETCTKVDMLEIPWEFFYCFCDEACHHHKQIIKNMLEILSKKEFLALKKLNIVNSTSLKERLCIWLAGEADKSNIVRLKMKREALADFLGVDRPSLSRTLMKLQAEGLIEVHRKEIKIIDRKKLELFCE